MHPSETGNPGTISHLASLLKLLGDEVTARNPGSREPNATAPQSAVVSQRTESGRLQRVK